MCIRDRFIIGRAFFIQQAEGDYWREMGKNMQVKDQPIEAERGSIYSEDGNMLSTSIPVFDIYVDFAADGLREKPVSYTQLRAKCRKRRLFNGYCAQ